MPELEPEPSAPLTILIADDHAFIRQALRNTLEKAGFKVAAEVDNGLEAVKRTRELSPDVVVMDIGMPGLNGIEATRIIKETQPSIIVLVLTVHDDTEHVLSMLEAGADGYLTKNVMPEEIVQALRSLSVGETVVSTAVFKDILSYALKHSEKRPSVDDIPALTSREMEILKLVTLGKSNKEIGQILGISARTVKGHCMDIFKKLDVYSRTEAAITALRLNIITLSELE